MKGKTNNPNGRPPGSKNRSTSEAREAIAMFVNDNAERLQGWLDKIAEDNPRDAFDRFMAVVEYHIPKLARSENKSEIIHKYAMAIPEKVETAEEWVRQSETIQ
jgi:hypothetical protein